jgi:hypothetical protein
VAAFCTELRHLTQRCSLSATAASRRLHISRSQYYAVINGEVRRPPDWSKVEVILRMCEQPDTAIGEWRQRHDEMVLGYDRLRTRRRALPPTDAAPDSAAAVVPAPESGPAPASDDDPAPEIDLARGTGHGAEPAADDEPAEPDDRPARRASWRRVLTVATVVVLLAAVGGAAARIAVSGEPGDAGGPPPSTGPSTTATVLPALADDGTLGGPLPGAAPETGNPADPDERKACVSDAPPPGTELLTVPRRHRPGNNKMNNDWWGSTEQVSFNAANPAAFDANVAAGGEHVWDVIILHSCVPLVAGHRYLLRFTAATNPAGPVMMRVQDSVQPEASESVTQTLDFTPRAAARTISFTAKHTSRSSEVTFQVGDWEGPFRLRVTDISLTETA